jgi:uncharacterized protein YutE (UPF0331/DUF86 family)
MGCIISYINNCVNGFSINKREIIKRYYLDRLFDNFHNDKSPKHMLVIIIEEDCDEIKYVKLILAELNKLLQNSNYKYFVRNNSQFGKKSYKKIKDSIIYSLYIINHKQITNEMINTFIKYIVDSLIDMCKSIINDKKILRNKNKYEFIINKMYNQLIINELTYIINNCDQINNLILMLDSLKTSGTIIHRLKIIYSLLIGFN